MSLRKISYLKIELALSLGSLKAGKMQRTYSFGLKACLKKLRVKNILALKKEKICE